MPSDQKPTVRIFLSSVASALNIASPPDPKLGSLRTRLERALSFKDDHSMPCRVEVLGMESFNMAGEKDTFSGCLKRVDGCDLFVGIIGPVYGEIPDLPDNPDRWSFTEAEFRRAEKNGIPMFVYHFRIHHDPNDYPQPSTAQIEAQQKWLKRYRDDLKAPITPFRSVDELLRVATDAVGKRLRGEHKQTPPPPPPERVVRIGGDIPFRFKRDRFKDRETSLATLVEKIKDPSTRVILIEGKGGIGKSQLAAKLCEEHLHEPLQVGGARRVKPKALAAENNITGVVYFSFRQNTGFTERHLEVRRKVVFSRDVFLDSFKSVLSEVEAEKFKVWQNNNGTANAERVFKELFSHCADGHVVVFLDNFEDVVDHDEIVNEDLAAFFRALACDRAVTAVVTTRTSFARQLCDFHLEKVDQLHEDDCLSLMRELDADRAGEANIAIATVAELRDIATKTGGNPRALELVVSVLMAEGVTPGQLLEDRELWEGDVLANLVRDGWEHATVAERKAGRALAILRGSAKAENLAPLLGGQPTAKATRKLLLALAHKYLVSHDAANQTFSLHSEDMKALLAELPLNDKRLLHTAAAAEAVRRQKPAAQIATVADLKDWDEAFQQYLEMGDLRAAWNAIAPLVPDVLWEKNLGSEGFTWLEELLGRADHALRDRILPAYCSLLFHYAHWKELLPLAQEWRTTAEKQGEVLAIANAYNMEGLALNSLGRPHEAEPLFRKAMHTFEAVFSRDSPQFAVACDNLAEHFRALKRHGEAEPLIREAIRILTSAYGPDHPHVATASDNLAGLLREMHRHDEAEPLVRDALRIFRAYFGDDHPEVATASDNLAGLLLELNRLPEAEALYRDALRIDLMSLGPDHLKVAKDRRHLAQLLITQGQYGEAEHLLRDSLRIIKSGLGSEHPKVADAMGQLALLLRDLNRHEEAAPLLHTALSVYKSTFGDDHPSTATALTNLAILLHDLGRVVEAERLQRAALQTFQASFGVTDQLVAIALGNLAQLQAQTGCGAEAVGNAKSALLVGMGSLAVQRWITGACQRILSEALLSRNHPSDVAKAAEAIDMALTILRDAFPPDHRRVANALRVSAKIKRAQGDHAGAVDDLRESARIELARQPVALRDAAETHEQLAEALAALRDAAANDEAKSAGVAKEAVEAAAAGADFRARYDAQEAHARAMIAKDKEWLYRAQP